MVNSTLGKALPWGVLSALELLFSGLSYFLSGTGWLKHFSGLMGCFSKN